MVADPRARVFVLFLDTYHVGRASALNIRRPLINMLNRLAGPEDLIALMTPDMAASDITFTRRTDKIADLIDRAGFWGQRNELVKKDPIDQMSEQCYPPEAGSGRATSVIAEEMIQRRREKATLDALEELVFYLGGLREERRASCSSAKDGCCSARIGLWRRWAARLSGRASTWGRTAASRRQTRGGSPAWTPAVAIRIVWRWRASTTPAATWTSSAWPIDRTRASTRSSPAASWCSTPTSGPTRRRRSPSTSRCSVSATRR
ncbi:MAG: hypothetical protein MZV64_15290 [Ignavibacteriales bacterium]|nr:hypothetical protein [Ignavibacteriales bacterium]